MAEPTPMPALAPVERPPPPPLWEDEEGVEVDVTAGLALVEVGAGLLFAGFGGGGRAVLFGLRRLYHRQAIRIFSLKCGRARGLTYR